MTIAALVPLVIMLTAVDGKIKIIVIECRGFPPVVGMTQLAIGRELCGLMIRVIRLVIIIAVASETGIGCCIVIPFMTIETIISNG